MTALEAIAAAFGVLCVVLTIRQNIWCWPTGLVMVVLYIYIFADAKLYADAGLQVIYIVLSIYGWVHWARGGDRDNPLPVTTLSGRARAAWILAALLGTASLGFGLSRLTDAALPYPDAFIASLSLVAQWLMARKKLESWLAWITVDAVAIAVFAAKELYITSGLYALFLGLAIAGYLGWKKSRDAATGSSSASSSRPTAAISSSSNSPAPSAPN